MVRRGINSDDDDEDEILFRYPLPNSSTTTTTTTSSFSSKSAHLHHPAKPSPAPPPPHGGGSGSGGLAPSKSTVYVSNLDFTLTNSDIHTIFSTFGKVARVTVLKDRHSRRSRGVAFVLFVSRRDAAAAVTSMEGKILNGRTVSASIAADNGRAAEFIRRRVYKDKSRCYECGDSGHLSYDCPKNQLGPREKPNPKRLRRGAQRAGGGDREDGGLEVLEEEEQEEVFVDDNWASVVDTRGADERAGRDAKEKKVKKEKKASYFSDESGEDD